MNKLLITFCTILTLLFSSVQTSVYAVTTVPSYSLVATATDTAPKFTTEAEAQAHCPNDEVVWLNLDSGVYHEKGMRWYGRTKHGAFVCRKEADAEGDRDTRNGQ